MCRRIVERNDNIDLVALEAAGRHMGGFAWPTVGLVSRWPRPV
jgi:hypothetical protein